MVLSVVTEVDVYAVVVVVRAEVKDVVHVAEEVQITLLLVMV